MKVYRLPVVRCLFIFVWCVTLLHMTFFMASVAALKLEGNRALIENAKKLLSCSSFEEETDSSEGGESRYSMKEINFIGNNLLHTLNENRCLTILIKFLDEGDGPRSGFLETFSPPPDFHC